jgi:hypothetical protein
MQNCGMEKRIEFAAVIDFSLKEATLPLGVLSLYSWYLHGRTFSDYRVTLIGDAEDADLQMFGTFARRHGVSCEIISGTHFEDCPPANTLQALKLPRTAEYTGVIAPGVLFTPSSNLIGGQLNGEALAVSLADAKEVKDGQWYVMARELGMTPVIGCFEHEGAKRNGAADYRGSYAYFDAGLVCVHRRLVSALRQNWFECLRQYQNLLQKKGIDTENLEANIRPALALAVGYLSITRNIELSILESRFNYTAPFWKEMDTPFEAISFLHLTEKDGFGRMDPLEDFCQLPDINPPISDYINGLAEQAFAAYAQAAPAQGQQEKSVA